MRTDTRLRIGLNQLLGSLETSYWILWRLKLDCEGPSDGETDELAAKQLLQMLARLNVVVSETHCWLEQLGGRL